MLALTVSSCKSYAITTMITGWLLVQNIFANSCWIQVRVRRPLWLQWSLVTEWTDVEHDGSHMSDSLLVTLMLLNCNVESGQGFVWQLYRNASFDTRRLRRVMRRVVVNETVYQVNLVTSICMYVISGTPKQNQLQVIWSVRNWKKHLSLSS